MKVLKKAELKLWVYSGDIRNFSPNPDYILTKTKLSSETTIVFEIAELIKDFIEIKFDGDYNTLIQSMWAKYKIERTYEDDIDNSLSTTSYSAYNIAFRGYGENGDGINPELSPDLLMSNRVIYKKCGELTSFPLYVKSPDGVVDVEYYQGSTALTSEEYIDSTGRYSVAQSMALNPSLDAVATIDKTASQNSSSDSSVLVSQVPRDADRAIYTKYDGTTGEIPIVCVEECKNVSYKVSFLNKFGVMQDIWFTAKRTDSMSSTREKYKRTKLDTSNGITYSKSAHQNVYLENQGKEKLTMNTGFIDESYNEVIKQLLVSEYVYMYDTNTLNPTSGIGFLAVPVTVASSDVSFKTRLNDKLIEYTLEFEADSDFIQSVR